MIILANYCPVLAEAGRQPGPLRRFLCVLGLRVEICTFLRRFCFSTQLTYVEAGAGGPDVAVVTGDHCILNNFCGEELIVDITLPGHGEAGVGV